MADAQVPCYICGAPCKNYGSNYPISYPISVCADCDHSVHDKLKYYYYPSDGNGYKTGSDHANAAEVLRTSHVLNATSTHQSTSMTRQEKPCKQCGRKNDLGVSKCWNCECPSPTV